MNSDLGNHDSRPPNGAKPSDIREPVIKTQEISRSEMAPVDERLNVTTASNQSSHRRKILAGGAVLIVALAASAYYFWFLAPYESTDDATIEGHVTAVAPQISGRVTQVLVQDNQEVKEGDVLLEIDPRDYETKLLQAQANLTAARSELAQAKAQFAVDQAKVTQERASLIAAEAQAGYAQAHW